MIKRILLPSKFCFNKIIHHFKKVNLFSTAAKAFPAILFSISHCVLKHCKYFFFYCAGWSGRYEGWCGHGEDVEMNLDPNPLLQWHRGLVYKYTIRRGFFMLAIIAVNGYNEMTVLTIRDFVTSDSYIHILAERTHFFKFYYLLGLLKIQI